jgi:hypothetical protein
MIRMLYNDREARGTQARQAEVPLVMVLAWIGALAVTTLGLMAFQASFGG